MDWAFSPFFEALTKLTPIYPNKFPVRPRRARRACSSCSKEDFEEQLYEGSEAVAGTVGAAQPVSHDLRTHVVAVAAGGKDSMDGKAEDVAK